MINLLVKSKSPLNATDQDGQTALHHAIAEGHGKGVYSCSILKGKRFDVANVRTHSVGDAAVALLKAGAETDKKDVDGHLAVDLAPDKEVSASWISVTKSCFF